MTQVNSGTKVMIPCWICDQEVEIKFTKKDKPYLICNNCGIQTFVRYGQAEDLLKQKVREYRKEDNDG